MSDQLHLAYITTGYPYVSHTFIQNEVLALRRLGVTIDTFAVRRESVDECRTPADREAWETTYPLRPPRVADYLRAHGAALTTSPRRYLAALAGSLRRGRSAPAALARHLSYFGAGVVLWHRCRLRAVQHLHAHFANVSSDLAMIASSLGDGDLSWSFTMHGPTEFYDVRHFQLGEKARAAQFVVCISEFARSQLMGLVAPEQWDKLEVVHCGIDTARFVPPPPAATPEGVRVTCVGRLVPEKAQRLLIEAAAEVGTRGLDLRLRLAGDGPERPHLEQLAGELGVSSRVEFLGAVAHTEIDQLLAQTDIFCLPSFAEGVPIVLMEAMATGIPVVASHVMGIPELIVDGVSGRLVRPGSREDLVDALTELARDPARRQALGRAARDRVRSEFDLEDNARLLQGTYRKWVSG
ncbi:MAG: glycosyltransferase [Solirubrobacteraceae bacterium]